jgi:hypothetical protein
MSDTEKEIFKFDVRRIDWKCQLEGFQYGIRRYYMREDVYDPRSGWVQLLRKNQFAYFYDLRVALHSKGQI